MDEIAARTEIIGLIEHRMHLLGYKFDINKYYNSNDGFPDYDIKLVNYENEQIGKIQISIIPNHTLRQKHGKSTDRLHPEGSKVTVIKILLLEVNKQYSGNNFGILMLIYGMCFISQIYSTFIYYILDDVSDRSDYVRHNIYSKLGFTFDDTIALSHNVKVVEGQEGPEKTAYVGGSFWRDLYNKTITIIKKKDNAGKPLSRNSLSRKVKTRIARIVRNSLSRKVKSSKAINASKSRIAINASKSSKSRIASKAINASKSRIASKAINASKAIKAKSRKNRKKR